jgi:HPt (histidine-containing phosphotransfer) domain-containing protein
VSDPIPVTNSGAAPTALVDHERVAEVIDLVCEGEPGAFGKWIDYLVADLAKFQALLPGASTAESHRGIQSAAHSIKGTCLNLGAQALGELFSALEQEAREGNSAALNQRYAASRDLETQSIQALRAATIEGDPATPRG